MKKIIKQQPQDEQSLDILKRVAKRVEEATVDIHEMKRDLKFVNLRLGQVERNTELMKVDMEKMRAEIGEIKTDMTRVKKDIKEIKRNTEGLIETTAHILKEAVTHDEHNALSQRVFALEQS